MQTDFSCLAACGSSLPDNVLPPTPGETVVTISGGAVEQTLLPLLRRILPAPSAYVEDIRHVLEIVGELPSAWAAIPALCCTAVGGDPKRGRIVSQAWQLLLLVARILDDVEDDEAEASLSPARWLNAATGMQAAAPLVILELGDYGVSADVLLGLLHALYTATLHACAGQQQDLSLSPGTSDLAAGWRSAAARSGTPCALGCRMGALIGDGMPEQVTTLEQFGYHLGIANQILDDIAGVWHPGDGQDLQNEHMTLPLLYALEVADLEQRHTLCTNLEGVGRDLQARQRIRTQLLDLGALHYLMVELECHRQAALQALASVGAPSAIEARLRDLLPVIAGRHVSGAMGA